MCAKGCLGLLAIFLSLLSLSCASSPQPEASSYYSVYYDPITSQYSVRSGKDTSGAVAWAEWDDERFTTGWARFNMVSNSVYEDDKQAYGAGYLEGYLSSDLIWASWYNTLQNGFGGKPKDVILQFFNQNLNWMLGQVALYAKSDPYWQHVHLLLTQLKGIQAGYNAKVGNSSTKALNYINFLLLNAGGDLETISNKFKNDTERAPTLMKHTFGTHCSSFIKVTPDMGELYAGHTTWGSYFAMVRVFKSYTFSFKSKTTATSTMFSSYPACLSSIDDFYQLSTKLVVIETTNGISFNPSLYKLVTPLSVLSWLRIVVANRLATGGPSWIDNFKRYNSGTYNNQWILVDYSLFKPYEPLPPNLLWIAEQIPGLVESADVTSYLRNGYWPSYNIPFFPKIYSTSGFDKAIQTYGDWLTYDLHPRAQIFRRDANNVKNLQEYMKLLRYNNWKNDPLADGSPGNQISSRFDLVPTVGPPPPNPYLARGAFGGTDSKATSSQLVAQGRVFAQSGPTHDSLAPFDWRVGNWNIVHEGMPDVFNFGWIDMPTGKNASASSL